MKIIRTRIKEKVSRARVKKQSKGMAKVDIIYIDEFLELFTEEGK